MSNEKTEVDEVEECPEGFSQRIHDVSEELEALCEKENYHLALWIAPDEFSFANESGEITAKVIQHTVKTLAPEILFDLADKLGVSITVAQGNSSGALAELFGG